MRNVPADDKVDFFMMGHAGFNTVQNICDLQRMVTLYPGAPQLYEHKDIWRSKRNHDGERGQVYETVDKNSTNFLSWKAFKTCVHTMSTNLEYLIKNSDP